VEATVTVGRLERLSGGAGSVAMIGMPLMARAPPVLALRLQETNQDTRLSKNSFPVMTKPMLKRPEVRIQTLQAMALLSLRQSECAAGNAKE